MNFSQLKSSRLLLLGIIAMGIVCYLPSLRYGFSQDDFTHLAASQAHSIGQFLSFFNPFVQFEAIFFYRPLTTQAYFFVLQSIFGLNPMVFHLAALAVHGLNIWLFYLLAKKLFKKETVALLGAFFYAISAMHFLSFYFISAFQQLGRTTFIFIALILFLRFIDTKKRLSLIVSLIAFVLALLSKETSIIVPLLLFPTVGLAKDVPIIDAIKKYWKWSLPFFAVAAVYIAVRALAIHILFAIGGYDVTFSIHEIIQNAKWYVLWTIGLPETLTAYPALNIQTMTLFIKDFPEGIAVIGFLVIMAIIFIWSIPFQWQNLKQTDNWTKKAPNLLAFFIIPLLPVLFLQGHKYPHYLDVPSVASLSIIAIIALNIYVKKRLFAWLFIGAFVGLQVASMLMLIRSHWAVHRAETASYYQSYVHERYPSPRPA